MERPLYEITSLSLADNFLRDHLGLPAMRNKNKGGLHATMHGDRAFFKLNLYSTREGTTRRLLGSLVCDYT